MDFARNYLVNLSLPVAVRLNCFAPPDRIVESSTWAQFKAQSIVCLARKLDLKFKSKAKLNNKLVSIRFGLLRLLAPQAQLFFLFCCAVARLRDPICLVGEGGGKGESRKGNKKPKKSWNRFRSRHQNPLDPSSSMRFSAIIHEAPTKRLAFGSWKF